MKVIEAPTLAQMDANPNYQNWLINYNKGLDFIRRRTPGLVVLWRASLGYGFENTLDNAALSLQLGLYLTALPQEDRMQTGLSVEDQETLIRRSFYVLEPDIHIDQPIPAFESRPSFEEQLSKIDQAYAIIGQRAAGKGTFLEMLKKQGVYCVPSSDVLRDYVRYNLQETLVPILIETAIELKAQFGPGVLIRWTLVKVFERPENEWKRFAIDGLRTEEEIEAFRKMFGLKGKVIAIQADSKVMWERVQKRQQETGRVDFKDYGEFEKSLMLEYERIKSIMEKADITVDNSTQGDRGLQKLEAKAKEFLFRSS